MKFLIGLLAGISAALGVGSGTILIVFLVTFLGLDQRSSQAINLICYIPTSIVCIFLNIKNKNIHFKSLYPILYSGVIGSVLGSFISKNMNIILLKKVFGIFLIVIALSEIYSLIKHKKREQ